jgi:lysophospholipase L1-like esterase
MQTTSTSRLIRTALAAWLASLILVATMASPALAHDGEGPVAPPKRFYLSLGDSMAFGLQFDRLYEMLDAGTYTPDAFNTGYTDVLGDRMRRLRANQRTVNLSCPGETTDTMVTGGCFFTAPEPQGPGLTLHTSYAGSQMDAALSFLRAHRHAVNPITLTIGAIDAADVIAETCNFDVACVKQSHLRENLGRSLNRIIRDLRANAPGSQIVLVSFYNPFSITNPGTDGLWQHTYTAAQNEAARRNGVRIVDLYGTFRGDRLCRLTFVCSSGDSHPTDLGYGRIAHEIFAAAGFRHRA